MLFRSVTVMPYSGTLKNLYIRIGATVSGSGNIVLTLMKNGVATAITITCTNADGNNYTKSDTTNTVSVVAGDLISIRGVNAGSASGTIVSTTLCLER